MNQVTQLNGEYNQLLASPSISEDIKMWAIDEVMTIQPLMDLVLEPRSFERFLADFVQRAVEDDSRETPPCLCRNSSCSLLHGNLPVQIIRADDVQRGIYEFRRDHGGDPVVLRDAEEAYREIRMEVISTLRRVIAALSSGQKIQREEPAPELTAFA